MRGKHAIVVQNRNIRFSFELERNISIIRGNSATGKTTLISMISDFHSQGAASGVQLYSDKKCVVLSSQNANEWQNSLKYIEDSIVFIDEGECYTSSKEFAEAIKATDNYYVIVTRNNLYDIPYSIDAIFEIKTSGKYGKLKRTYNSFKKMYGSRSQNGYVYKDNDIVLVEDEKSGYQFFKRVSDDVGARCESVAGKSGFVQAVTRNKNQKQLIVADGAAFGSEMANVYGLLSKYRINLFLPESFEWLILNSGIVNDKHLKEILANPSDYIESGEYFSWEQFFASYLISISQNEEYRYSKKRINDYYLSTINIKKILCAFFEDYK